MEETTFKVATSLLNYGAVGLLALLAIGTSIWSIRHLLKREEHHEKKYEGNLAEILKVHQDQTKLTTEFNSTINDFKESQQQHTQVIRDLTTIINNR